MKQLIFLLLLTASFVVASCGGDDAKDCSSASLNFTQEFSNEIQDISNAAIEYANDPTSSNCNTYKNAIRDYINALKSFEDCAREAGQLTEYNASLSQYESQIDSLC
jgi:hypothetical protein